IVPDRKARLLLVSSQASPPSSIVSFHSGTANFTDSSVSLLFRTTVLPSASTSLPPHDQRYGYHQPGASPKVWPAVWPKGWPAAFSFLPAARYSSQFCGNFSGKPASASQDLRYATSPPPTQYGTPIHLPPWVATILQMS